MISKAELERGIRATEAQLSEAMTDPEFRRECAEMDARYAAMELVESLNGAWGGCAGRKNMIQ